MQRIMVQINSLLADVRFIENLIETAAAIFDDTEDDLASHERIWAYTGSSLSVILK